MESMERRVQLFLVLSLLIFLGTTTYMNAKYPQANRRRQPAGETAMQPTPDVATPVATPATRETVVTTPAEPEWQEGPRVHVRTDIYDIEFATNGAVPVRWDIIDPAWSVRERGADGLTTSGEPLIDARLADYPELPRPFQIVLQELGQRFYNEFNHMVYEHSVLDWAGLVHRFMSPTNEVGLRLVKTFTFTPDSYLVDLQIELINESGSNIRFGDGARGLGLIMGPGLGGSGNGGRYDRYSTVDAVLLGDDFLHEHISKPAPGSVTMAEELTIDRTIHTGPYSWGGIVSKYFAGVVIPDEASPFTGGLAMLDNRVLGTLTNDRDSAVRYPLVQLFGAPFMLEAGRSISFDYTVYMGPKQKELLDEAGHDLTRVMFHNSSGFMRGLCMLLLVVLFCLHDLLRNWGLAIMALTVLVRLATLPIVHKAMKSQAKMTQEMAKIRPLVEKVNEKYKNDPQRKQQELMKLYREHNINPLGMLKGCGFMLIQLPIFIGLYTLLYQVIDLRGAGFLWIDDLSAEDRLFSFGINLPFIGSWFNLLPIIVAVTQMLSAKFMQTPASDPQQVQMQKMMTWFMPLFILAITYRFPAGLMLYWLVSNLWQVVQQVYVNKVIRKPQQTPA